MWLFNGITYCCSSLAQGTFFLLQNPKNEILYVICWIIQSSCQVTTDCVQVLPACCNYPWGLTRLDLWLEATGGKTNSTDTQVNISWLQSCRELQFLSSAWGNTGEYLHHTGLANNKLHLYLWIWGKCSPPTYSIRGQQTDIKMPLYPTGQTSNQLD